MAAKVYSFVIVVEVSNLFSKLFFCVFFPPIRLGVFKSYCLLCSLQYFYFDSVFACVDTAYFKLFHYLCPLNFLLFELRFFPACSFYGYYSPFNIFCQAFLFIMWTFLFFCCIIGLERGFSNEK
nr:MAG TPA_asm: hypothetical protein [Caudoviricetes sp.]